MTLTNCIKDLVFNSWHYIQIKDNNRVTTINWRQFTFITSRFSQTNKAILVVRIRTFFANIHNWQISLFHLGYIQYKFIQDVFFTWQSPFCEIIFANGKVIRCDHEVFIFEVHRLTKRYLFKIFFKYIDVNIIQVNICSTYCT